MLFTALALAAALQADADSLAPARRGQVECFGFDAARKTCRAIGAYRFAADGIIVNDATLLLNTQPLVIMRTSNPVYLRNGVECARVPSMRDQIISIEIDGAAVEGANLEAMKQRAATAFDGLSGAGGEFCGRYDPQPDGSFIQRVQIDGVAHPDKDDAFLWVDPAEGWRVAP